LPSIDPLRSSASIAICLPGIASSTKRAPTSATLAAFRNDHELDDREDAEDDPADDVVASHDEISERLNDLSRIRLKQDEQDCGNVAIASASGT
jgi:hypothetical protein